MKSKINNSFKESVLVCQQCGNYSLNDNKSFQICTCTTLLKFGGEKLDNVNEIIDCKICTLIASKSCGRKTIHSLLILIQ